MCMRSSNSQFQHIRSQERPCHILLQNENGPCPLLAAANILLLQDSITLPSNCVGAGVITIDELLNVLAEKILTSNTTGNSDHHIQQVMNLFPTLQFGMDVNPKFTEGPTGVEYTSGLDAFDLLRMEMVHGWLLDPEAPEFCLVKDKTYNQLVNKVIEGNDAGSALELEHQQQQIQQQQQSALDLLEQQQQQQQQQSDDNDDPNTMDTAPPPNTAMLLEQQQNQRNEDLTNAATTTTTIPSTTTAASIQSKIDELSTKANEGAIIRQFLESSGHQLTQYGLTVLHEYLKDDQMAVFFRNNHFNSLLKHQGQLYLLITDIGYASVGNIVWEKLDVIDGDTEYVTQDFTKPPPMQHHEASNTANGEQLVANDLQSQADYQLALQLSQETTTTTTPNANANSSTPQQQQQQQQAQPPTVASLPSSSSAAAAAAPTPTPSGPIPPSFNGQNIAMAVPTDLSVLSEEERDRMVAMQLQQQEELQQQQQRQQQEANSHNLALQLQREEELQQQQQQQQQQSSSSSSNSAQAAAVANANNPKRKGKGKDGDCVIM
ncbi:unnamed protein product [Cylindrotheca closterium]|uniref:MINDY deubiquitinase domain-containing protein n=1 Tax=Cylindrotheca closterium TaxID=2856 RepID=A0AAD2G533_9STRA|nr:unnamed protein product [Cylindrotheca closterium]